MSAETVLEWVHKAEGDYENARILARQRKKFLPDNICWSCQQCAEKYAKAFLTRHLVQFSFTHNLTGLLKLCLDIDPDFRLISDPLQFPNPFGPEIRCPGARTTRSDARQAVEAVKQVRKFVRSKLGLRSR